MSVLHCSIVIDVVAVVAVVDMAAPVADCCFYVVVVVPLVDADPTLPQGPLPPLAMPPASGIVRKCHPNLIQH